MQHLVVCPQRRCVILIARSPKAGADALLEEDLGVSASKKFCCTRLTQITPCEANETWCNIRVFRRESCLGIPMQLPASVVGNYHLREFSSNMEALLTGWKSCRDLYRQRVRQERTRFYAEVAKIEMDSATKSTRTDGGVDDALSTYLARNLSH